MISGLRERGQNLLSYLQYKTLGVVSKHVVHVLHMKLVCNLLHLITSSLPPSSPILSGLQDTFQRAKSWVKELQRQASPNIVIALSGNKADLASKRMVDFEVGGFNWIIEVLIPSSK